MLRNLIFWVLVVVLSGALIGAPAQDRKRSLDDVTVENVQVQIQLEYVQLSFLVRDSEGNLIRNLAREEFSLSENGKPVRIVALKEEEVPINRRSHGGHKLEHGFVSRKCYQRGPAVLGGSGARALNLCPFFPRNRGLSWTGKKVHSDSLPISRTRRQMAKPAYTIRLSRWSARGLQDEGGKKLIILITDGIDTKSDATLEDMMQATREAGITLYPIIYSNAFLQDYRRRLSSGTSQPSQTVSLAFHTFMLAQNEFLERSMRLGGRTIFSERFADLKDVYGDIISEMKSHYSLSYQPDVGSGRDRKIKISTRRMSGRIFIDVSR